MEKEYKVSWFKVLGILALIVVIIAIIWLVYPKKESKGNITTSSVYLNNITMMKEAGFEYFKGNNLPDKIGESNKLSLEEMISSNLIVDFVDENGNACNQEDSYIQATKTLDDEYSLKVFLSCEEKTDYVVTTIVSPCINCDNQEEETDNNIANNQSNSSNKNPTNNGGNYRPVNNITQITNYNINHINSCNNCSGSNCLPPCLSNIYYTVSFNSNGGSYVASQTVKRGSTAVYQTTTRDGYTFLGWYLDGVKYDFSTPVTARITLIAKWKKVDGDKKQYDVLFETNGGSKIPNQSVWEGDKVLKPNNPTKSCYEFAGWYTNSKFTKKYDFSTPVYKDMTLYAKWIDDGSCVETHKVRFNSNGGTSVKTQKVEDGGRAFEPNNPVKNGYIFLGWYLDGEKFNFKTRIYEDITLVAKWEKEETKYYTYCKINEERYYSTSYVNGNQTTRNYDWTIRFDNIRGADLEILNIGYITTNTMYNQLYNNYLSGKGISMVGSTGKYDVAITSGSMLKTYSLKSSNFDKYLSNPYYSGGYWYVDASVRIRNYYNVTKYYAPNLKDYIYFVPFYFDVRYTDTYNCFDDKASKLEYYEDSYKVVNTFYK